MNNTTNPTAPAFVKGATYSTRSMGDSDCIFEFTVIARTAKFVTLDDGDTVRRVGIYAYDGIEKCRPFGTYSMCPILSADRI